MQIGEKLFGSLKQFSLVSEGVLPEVRGVALGDPEGVAGEGAVGEDGLELAEHVTEDEAELGEVAAVRRAVVEHLLLAVLKQLDGLLALLLQVLEEDLEGRR